jgi:hypothetical protein
MADDNKLKNLQERGLELAGWLIGFVVFTFIIPVSIIFLLLSNKVPEGFAVLAAIPFIEYLAISVGIGLGIHPVISFFLTVLPCTGITMLMIGLLGFIGDSSPRVIKFLNKVQKWIDKYPKLKKYGVLSNFMFIMFFGAFITPGISIILGWSRSRSTLLMAAGICVITFLIGLGTIGIIEIFFV